MYIAFMCKDTLHFQSQNDIQHPYFAVSFAILTKERTQFNEWISEISEVLYCSLSLERLVCWRMRQWIFILIFITSHSNLPQYSHNILCMFTSEFEPLNCTILLFSPGQIFSEKCRVVALYAWKHWQCLICCGRVLFYAYSRSSILLAYFSLMNVFVFLLFQIFLHLFLQYRIVRVLVKIPCF